MHGDPHFKVESKIFRHQLDKIYVPLRNGGLADTDPKPRSNRRKLAEVTIRSNRKIVSRQLQTYTLQCADWRRFTIEAYQHMLRQLLDIVGLAMLIKVMAVRMQAHGDGSKALADETTLLWSHHPYGDRSRAP
jgi:hypothetical protein